MRPSPTCLLSPARDAQEAGSAKRPSVRARSRKAARISSSVTQSMNPPESRAAATAPSQLAGFPMRMAVATVSGLGMGLPRTMAAAPSASKPCIRATMSAPWMVAWASLSRAIFLLGLGHGHDHAAVLEGAGRIGPLDLGVEFKAEFLREVDEPHEGCVAFLEGQGRGAVGDRKGETYPIPLLMPGSIHLVIGGAEAHPDVPPQIVNGRVMVPIRFVSPTGANVGAEILKVGHHGSSTSTTAQLLAATDPEYAVISVGAGNSYGHPAANTLASLAAAGVMVYWTDLNGTIVATATENSVWFDTEKGSRESGGGGGTSPSTVIVYVTKTGAEYHRAGCQYLSSSCIPMTLEAAKAAGCTPCSVCDPPT